MKMLKVLLVPIAPSSKQVHKVSIFQFITKILFEIQEEVIHQI